VAFKKIRLLTGFRTNRLFFECLQSYQQVGGLKVADNRWLTRVHRKSYQATSFI